MLTVPESDQALYREYRRHTEGEPLIRALRAAVFVLFAINTFFILVDWVIYPESMVRFLPVRIGLDLVLGGVYFGSLQRYPVASGFATIFAGGAMLFAVVLGTGGANSAYYAGLILLVIGIGVLAPFSGRQAVIGIGSLYGAYMLTPFVSDAPVQWSVFVLNLFFLGAGGFVGVMSAIYFDRMRFSDFLQRREIERARDELKELDREKSRFTANVHHELRTPLTLMLAPLDAMLSGDFGEISELQRSYVQTMHANAQRLLKLINNLLDLAKIEGRQLEVKRRLLRVSDVVEELVSGARPLAERKGVTLATVGLDALPAIHADPEALEKVVVNLVGNALKFTNDGGRIEIRGAPSDDGGVELAVVDDGEGIPPEQLDRIFDRFAQVDGSNTRRHEGTGIGLALVQELVELHGGRIWAESDGLGHGAAFRVALPIGETDGDVDEEVLQTDSGASASARTSLAAMEGELGLDDAGADGARLVEMERTVRRAEAAGAEPEPVPQGEGVGPDAREILIVEDNADMRRLLAFLVGQEYRVRVARNGREGLEKVRELAPDLVLTDVMMPEMSGTELCHQIKADPATWSIPVVLVTSKAERDMKIQGLERGADDYVTKPFHPRELMARVRALIRLRSLQDELGVRNALLESTNEELQSTLVELREAGSQLVQSERLAAVGELAAGVAHEVNNPINFATNALKTLRTYVEDITSVADRIGELEWDDASKLRHQARDLEQLRTDLGFDELSSALSELVTIVTEGLDRTHRLVGDLRDFAAPGDGPVGEVDLVRGLTSTIQLVAHATREAGAELRTDLPERLPGIAGDARALNQVFLNLLKNATEALEGRGGVIEVEARSDGESVLVEVRDDGPGVPEELGEELFEPFVSTKEAGRGTGLGLSISRRVVMEHGGTIDVESSPGEGATFRVRLPIRGATHEA